VCTSESGKVFEAEFVIVTVPLGVLKRQLIHFEPPLSPLKQLAIEHVGFGKSNKVIFEFPHVFWPTDIDTFYFLPPPSSKIDRIVLFINMFNMGQRPGLFGFVDMHLSDLVETLTEQELIDFFMPFFKHYFGPSIPHPVKAMASYWNSDKYTGGW
jgi:monoamine oxidase